MPTGRDWFATHDGAADTAAQLMVVIRDKMSRHSLLLALQFPLWHPAVATVIASISSLEHAEQAIGAISATMLDIERFTRMASMLRGSKRLPGEVALYGNDKR